MSERKASELYRERWKKSVAAGDLICYNAGNSKNKTLGLVLDIEPLFEHDSMLHPRSTQQILVQWSLLGPIMPRFYRKDSLPWERSWGNGPIEVGDMCWHELGNWFEPVAEWEE
jgi:hypothetical protein